MGGGVVFVTCSRLRGCRGGGTQHTWAGKQLPLSPDVLDPYFHLPGLQSLPPVEQGCLQASWNHLRGLSGASGIDVEASAPLLRNRPLHHCGPHQSHTLSLFFFFFNEAGQERIMDSLLLTLWLGSDTFPGELRGHYPVSCPADPSWGWQRKQLLILIPFSSAVNTLKLLLTLY